MKTKINVDNLESDLLTISLEEHCESLKAQIAEITRLATETVDGAALYVAVADRDRMREAVTEAARAFAVPATTVVPYDLDGMSVQVVSRKSAKTYDLVTLLNQLPRRVLEKILVVDAEKVAKFEEESGETLESTGFKKEGKPAVTIKCPGELFR